MIYESREEQERVESVESRIEDKTMIPINPESIGKCRLFESELYKERFYPESEDISMLSLLYLYSQGECASQYNRFGFGKLNGETSDYFVIRCGDQAVFCIEEELDHYEQFAR